MKMSKFEKKFANSQKHAEKTITIVDSLIEKIDHPDNITNVLETGCGIGLLASYFSNKYSWKIAGTDLDPDQIVRAKENNKENELVNFYESDAEHLPFGSNKFDLVLSSLVLHHIPAWNNVFTEINRVLKPGGHYIIYDVALLPVLTKKGFKNILEKHMGVYAVKDIADHLRKKNFEIVNEEKLKSTFLMNTFSVISSKIN